MRRKLCVALLLLCVAAVIVKSETTIEVDENGDEYEVKRFNIEGRSLHDGRSQCVVSRRKRATASEAAITPSDNSDEANTMKASNKNKKKKNHKKGNVAIVQMAATTPPSNVDINTSMDEEDNDDTGGADGQQEVLHHIGLMDTQGEKNDDNDDDYIDGDYDDENDDEEYNDEDMTHYVHLPAVSHRPQLEQYVSVPLPSNAASANGVVVVQANRIPQVVNPESQAYLAVEPFDFLNVGVDQSQGDEELLYNEELNPVTTTAIWSTGDDDAYDDMDLPPLKRPNQKVKTGGNNNKWHKKRPARPNMHNKKRRPNNKQKPKRKNNNNNNNMMKRRRPWTGKRRQGNGVRRRIPPAPAAQTVKDKRRNSNQNFAHNVNKNASAKRRKNQSVNANIKNNASKRKKNQNLNLKDQGTNTFTKTETMTQTGSANEDKDVNCIIIRKEGTTTPRPFWNILGRSAGATNVRGNGHFGQRKRANLRFVA